MSTFILRLDTAEGRPGVTRVAVKDIIDMEGRPTTCGSKVIAATETGAPARSDAACLAGIRARERAGQAVVVGKTNLHELAFGVSGINPWYGTPPNPLDAKLVPGGSSSGSAVAVATGEADVALGTDTGGSIRIPAACCGVVGLKTTRGRISVAGVRPLAPSLDTVGPMAATVAATAEGMALLEPGFQGGGAAGDPGRLRKWRVGRFRPPAEGWVDQAVDEGLRRAAVEAVDVELPGWERANEAVGLVLISEAWDVHAGLWRDHREDLSPDVAERLEMGSLIDRAEIAAAWEDARRWTAELASVLASVDLIALPVMAEAPPALEDGARVGAIRYTGPFNLAGLPAIALPVRSDRSPIPASLQLVGPAGSEGRLLDAAAAVEAGQGDGAGPGR